MQAVRAEKLGAFVDVQFEGASGPEVALVLGLASSEGAAGVRSPVELDSLGVSAAGADNRSADVAAADRGMGAGTVGGRQAEGACIRVGSLAESGEGGEVQEQPLVQAGIPEAAAARWAEGTAEAAAAALAAVVGMQEFEPHQEASFLVGA